jgi:hypothetical protein
VTDGPFIHLYLPILWEKTPVDHEMMFLKISCTCYTPLLTDQNTKKKFQSWFLIHTSNQAPWSQVGISSTQFLLDCIWNVMAHAQKPDFVFRRNGQVHLNRQGRQFSRLLAAEVCTSAVVMLDTPRSEVVWRVLATHSIRQFPLHFPSCASPCAITFQLDST